MKKYKTTPYQRGRAFEYRVKKRLAKNGYWTHRAYASRGTWDLLAMKPGVVLFIQVKSKREYMNKWDWFHLGAEAERAGAIPLLAYRIRKGRERPIIFEREDGERYEMCNETCS